MINSGQWQKFYQSPRDGMFSRKVGHYPPAPAEFTLQTQDQLPLHQPPMCTGKTLNFPDVLPAVKARKQFPEVESQYSVKNIKENYLKDKVMSGFTTV